MNFEEVMRDFPLAILILGKDFIYENEKAWEIRLRENTEKDIININNKIFSDKALNEIEKQLRRILETIEELRFREVLSFLLTKRWA